MRRCLFAVLLTIALGGLAGCTTIASTVYNTAADERSVGSQASDETLAYTVKGKLIDDPDLKARSMNVYCYYGRVFVVGYAESDAERDRVREIARRVQGVNSVEIHLPMRSTDSGVGESASDAAITAQVRANIIADKSLFSTQFDIVTLNGRVILLGVVRREQDRSQVIRIAHEVEGVRGVKSFIIVN